MFILRHKLLNGGGVMIMKRWLGFFWKDHENFDNKIFQSERKMQVLWEKMQAEKVIHGNLLKRKEQIIKEVGRTHGKLKGLGDIFSSNEGSFFAVPDEAKPAEDWKDAFKFSKTMKKVGSVGETYAVGVTSELAGVKTWELRPETKAKVNSNNNSNNNNQRGNPNN